jgi:long-chain acyl-CoA synthetase
MTLGGLLSTSAQRFPDSKAITFPGCTLTYARLQAWVEALADAFRAMGIGKGGTVSILLPNSPDYIASYFAVLRLGAAAVPLNTFLKAEELRTLIDDSGSTLLVTSSEFADAARAAADRVERVVTVDADDGVFVPHSRVSSEPSHAPAQDLDDDEPATLIYTSGTTGNPKGVVLTHRNLAANADSCGQIFSITSRDRFLVFLPLFHSFTLTVSTLLPLRSGARIVLCKSARPFARLLKRIATERVTVVAAVPAFYRALSKTRIPGLSLLLRSIRFFVSGSAPLPADVLETFEKRFGTPLLEGYGLSETSPAVAVNPAHGTRKPGSVGPALPGVELKIVDDAGASAAAGEVGEIAVRGPNVMGGGYLRMPEETEKVLKEGWLFTGDVGYLDADGYLFIVDRKRDLILHRGMNVYPREIEDVLAKHPGIAEAAVVGARHPSHGEVPEAYVIPENGVSLTPREVKDHCSGHLAAFKVPRAVHFIDDAPRTATGKIAKRKLVTPCES